MRKMEALPCGFKIERKIQNKKTAYQPVYMQLYGSGDCGEAMATQIIEPTAKAQGGWQRLYKCIIIIFRKTEMGGPKIVAAHSRR